MANWFTVVISSTEEISLNAMGKLLNMIETRGITIEEIHPDRLVVDDGDTYWASEVDESL
jgi:hypothetical protein